MPLALIVTGLALVLGAQDPSARRQPPFIAADDECAPDEISATVSYVSTSHDGRHVVHPTTACGPAIEVVRETAAEAHRRRPGAKP